MAIISSQVKSNTTSYYFSMDIMFHLNVFQPVSRLNIRQPVCVINCWETNILQLSQAESTRCISGFFSKLENCKITKYSREFSLRTVFTLSS